MNDFLFRDNKSSSNLNSNILYNPNGSIHNFNPPLRIGVMASGFGSNFESLATNIINKILSAQIEILVVNNPNCGAKSKAERLNINSVVLNHRDYNTREDLDHALINVFKENKVEIIIMAGWMRIVTDVLVDGFPNRIINIHPSILPSFKGKDAIQSALDYGSKITGCTIHIVNKEVDSGPIIIQGSVPILENDNKSSLRQRIQKLEYKLLPMAVSIIGKQCRGINIDQG